MEINLVSLKDMVLGVGCTVLHFPVIVGYLIAKEEEKILSLIRHNVQEKIMTYGKYAILHFIVT